MSQEMEINRVSGKQNTIVSYLPLSHIAAQLTDIWIPIKIGALTFFAQPDALRVRLGEVLTRHPVAFGGRG
jgi:long-chain-fatty-acid--CoA ligase ACSBG